TGDYLIHKIPLINRIYKLSQDVVHTFFGTGKPAFTKVVWVPFPEKKSYILGMIASDSLHAESDPKFTDNVSIFVPCAPNPIFGFMMIYKRDQLITLDISTEEALKFIVSCGVTPIYPKS